MHDTGGVVDEVPEVGLSQGRYGRREFLRLMGKSAAGAAGVSALPLSIQRALAIPPASRTGSLQDVEHIVILMQENRSFDHYYGTMRGVRGFGDRMTIPLGVPEVLRKGKDVTIVTYGATVQRAFAAANQLADEGLSAEVIDLRTLSPWDRETVFASVKKTSRVIVAYEDSMSWGYGAEIAAAIADECFPWLDAPVKRIASTDTFVGYAPQLEDAILPQIADFTKAYEEIVRF